MSDSTLLTPDQGLSARIGSLVEERVALRNTGYEYMILRPGDTDLLLDHAEADPEQNLPYWAEVWPSGIALAEAIFRQAELVRDQRVLEIGCGLGVTAIAALQAGAQLTVIDYSPEALVLCRHNALRNAGVEPEGLRVNWREPAGTLFELAGEGFPVVLVADAPYETRDVEPLLSLVNRVTNPGGLLWLAEPGRPVAQRFLAAAAAMGWSGPRAADDGPWPDPKDQSVVVGVHQLRRRSGR